MGCPVTKDRCIGENCDWYDRTWSQCVVWSILNKLADVEGEIGMQS